MKSDAPAISGQDVTATADTRQIRHDDAVRGTSPMSPAVADQGRIRLGGAFRLPASRKTA
jgi:hypothetical protein